MNENKHTSFSRSRGPPPSPPRSPTVTAPKPWSVSLLLSLFRSSTTAVRQLKPPCPQQGGWVRPFVKRLLHTIICWGTTNFMYPHQNPLDPPTVFWSFKDEVDGKRLCRSLGELGRTSQSPFLLNFVFQKNKKQKQQNKDVWHAPRRCGWIPVHENRIINEPISSCDSPRWKSAPRLRPALLINPAFVLLSSIIKSVTHQGSFYLQRFERETTLLTPQPTF